MEPADSISRLGFRKWYERQLIDSHASFVTCFLAMLMVAIDLEQLQALTLGIESLMHAALAFGFIVLGWYSWRRYHRVLETAEYYAEYSYCPACQAYGLFRVDNAGRMQSAEERRDHAETQGRVWMNVTCKKCAKAWRLPH
jgi:ribosomal protein L44E